MGLPAMRRPVYAGKVCPRLLNLDRRADVGEKNLVGELCMQLGRTHLSGTVRNTQPVKFQSGKVRNRCRELLITCRAKMRTADNRVNPRLIEILPNLPAYALENGVTKLSAAYLIEALGLKGLRYRGCQVSEQHALVLINTQSDRGEHCLELAQKVSDKVYEQFGVALEQEPSILGSSRDF